MLGESANHPVYMEPLNPIAYIYIYILHNIVYIQCTLTDIIIFTLPAVSSNILLCTATILPYQKPCLPSLGGLVGMMTKRKMGSLTSDLVSAKTRGSNAKIPSSVCVCECASI